jgi:hypothetical protein
MPEVTKNRQVSNKNYRTHNLLYIQAFIAAENMWLLVAVSSLRLVCGEMGH